LLVSSRLVKGGPVDLFASVAAAHKAGVPAIIDGAAQDMRIPELLTTGADLLLISAHKYLTSPTAGLIIGNKRMVQAVRAHEKGIGRAMKASKEAIIGVVAAIEERQKADLDSWRSRQDEKLTWFVEQANRIAGIRASTITDRTGMPFARACLMIEHSKPQPDITDLVNSLINSTPTIRIMEHALKDGRMILELVPLQKKELEFILIRISQTMDALIK
jgi:seryl-tRNA(Sec) selenium transferase